MPVYDYKGVLKLNDKQLEQWAVLDTLDGMYAQYENPMSFKRVSNLLDKYNVEIKYSSKIHNAFRTSLKN